MIRVAIVDDHPIARRGVASALAEAGGFDVVATAGSPRGLSAGDLRDPQVIVLDLYHAGRPCLAEIATLTVTTPVLVMSASGAPEDVVNAIRSRALGYITKQASVEDFADAVRTVAGGGFWLSSQLADILQTRLSGPAGPGEPAQVALSPREQEALDLVARGLTHAQAATRMGVKKATVDTYIERIRAKLQLGNKAELTRAAFGLARRDETRDPM